MIQVYVLDGLNRVAEVKDFISLSVTERDLDAGAWSIQLPFGQGLGGAAETWLSLAKPGIEVVEQNDGFAYGGYVTNYKIEYRPLGSVATLNGKDFQSRLANRLSYPDPANLSRWWTKTSRTMPLLSAVWWLVNNNCGPGALAHRRIPNFAMVPDPGMGDPKTFTCTGEPVLEVIKTWLAETPWTMRLKLDRKRDAGGAGQQVTQTFNLGARPYSGAVLHLGNLQNWTLEETASKTTWTLAQGNTNKAGVTAARAALGLGTNDPDPPVRYMTEAADPIVNQNWRNEYVEEMITRQAKTFPDLTAETHTYQDSIKPQLAVVVEDLEVQAYGRDLEIGWYVPFTPLSPTVQAGGGPFPDWGLVPVTAYTLTVTPDGVSKKITLGKREGGAFDGVFGRIKSAVDRARYLERVMPSEE